MESQNKELKRQNDHLQDVIAKQKTPAPAAQIQIPIANI